MYLRHSRPLVQNSWNGMDDISCSITARTIRRVNAFHGPLVSNNPDVSVYLRLIQLVIIIIGLLM